VSEVEGAQHVALTTERLTLRDFVEEDWGDVHAFRSDLSVARYMRSFEPERPEQSRAWLRDVIVHNRRIPRVAYNLGIELQSERRVIGWIGIGSSERYPEAGELDFGYTLHRDYWGQGFATEAARAIVDFGFRTLDGQRITAWCYEANLASARVLEKTGLVFVRRFEEAAPHGGPSMTSLEYEIVRNTWHRAPGGPSS
jgi:ribosomal-protein-alanine N-acetyltransferase